VFAVLEPSTAVKEAAQLHVDRFAQEAKACLVKQHQSAPLRLWRPLSPLAHSSVRSPGSSYKPTDAD
jgi:hypothetical protein